VPIHSPNSAPPNRSIERSKPRTDARVSHLSEGDSDDRRRAGLRALSRPLKMGTSARVPSIAALLGIVLIWSIASTALAVAHESWINRGGYRNSAGEWLCGVTERETPGQIAVTGKAKGIVARPDKSQKIPQVTFGSFGRRRAAFTFGEDYRNFPRWLGVFVSSTREITRPKGGIASNEVRSGPEQDVIRAFLFRAPARESRRLQQT